MAPEGLARGHVEAGDPLVIPDLFLSPGASADHRKRRPSESDGATPQFARGLGAPICRESGDWQDAGAVGPEELGGVF